LPVKLRSAGGRHSRWHLTKSRARCQKLIRAALNKTGQPRDDHRKYLPRMLANFIESSRSREGLASRGVGQTKKSIAYTCFQCGGDHADRSLQKGSSSPQGMIGPVTCRSSRRRGRILYLRKTGPGGPHKDICCIFRRIPADSCSSAKDGPPAMDPNHSRWAHGPYANVKPRARAKRTHSARCG